jgi:hypothetical protein
MHARPDAGLLHLKNQAYSGQRRIIASFFSLTTPRLFPVHVQYFEEMTGFSMVNYFIELVKMPPLSRPSRGDNAAPASDKSPLPLPELERRRDP